VRRRDRLTDENTIAFPDDLDCPRLLRCREKQALAGSKDGYDADRRSCLALRESGDDAKTVTLDGVVSDPRYLTEADALALHRAHGFGAGSCQGADNEHSGDNDVSG